MTFEMRVRDLITLGDSEHYSTSSDDISSLIKKHEQEAEYLRQRLSAGLVFSEKEKERLTDELQQLENDLLVLQKLNK